jgi:hypothetical protein
VNGLTGRPTRTHSCRLPRCGSCCVPVAFNVKAHPVMNASTQTKSKIALHLVTELHSLLLAHGECNWVRGVSHVGALLEANDLASAASAYKGMVGGNGSFSDFYIHSDDFDTRRRLNEPLDRLRDQTWVALDL